MNPNDSKDSKGQDPYKVTVKLTLDYPTVLNQMTMKEGNINLKTQRVVSTIPTTIRITSLEVPPTLLVNHLVNLKASKETSLMKNQRLRNHLN